MMCGKELQNCAMCATNGLTSSQALTPFVACSTHASAASDKQWGQKAWE